MSYADYLFIKNCKEILEHGIADTSFSVRPMWEDGTPAHTVKKLYVVDRYQLKPDYIPVMTMRKTAFKSCIDEILWIYQKGSNKIADLNSKIWDSWDVGDGTIGKAYGYQIAQVAPHHRYNGREDLSNYPSAKLDVVHDAAYTKYDENTEDIWVWLSQIDAVRYDLKNNPGSRSILTNTYAHRDLYAMGLRPCAYMMTFNVTADEKGNYILNGMLTQRSQDMLTANNWNTVQYAVLLHMLAQEVGMQVGEFVHVIADAHIYDRHIPVVSDMINRYEKMMVGNIYGGEMDDKTPDYLKEMFPHPTPKFWINPEVKNFYDFTTKDFKLIDYEYEPFEYKIPVAI